MKKITLYLPIILGAVLASGIFMGHRLNFPGQSPSMMVQNEKEQKLRQILNLIDYEYVDNVNTDSLLDLTITEMLRKLDPHSTYISQDNVQRIEESLRGNFDGIGIEYTQYRDSLVVVRTIADGPAARAGIKAGDRLLMADSISLVRKGMVLAEVAQALKGPAQSKVMLTVYRPHLNRSLSANITRGKVPIPSVEAVATIGDSIGIIKINRFAETTGDEVNAVLRNFKRQRIKNLIIDVRDNPGGLLRTAKEVSDEFLKKDQLIVYTQDRSGRKRYSYATRRGVYQDGNVVVLINEGSASAAEILAGALQDNDRATLIGRRTFGKGLVQEEMTLRDGSKVRLTTSRYYTPTGRSIQKPFKNGFEDYQEEARKRHENGELFIEDSIKINVEQEFKTPGGKTVYGGGGIVPDFFVPVDTSFQALGMLYHFFGFNTMDRFAFAFVDKNRKALDTLSLEDLAHRYTVPDKMIEKYMAEQKLSGGVDRLSAQMKEMVAHRMKALIAKNLYGMTGYYTVALLKDPMFLKSIEVFYPQLLESENLDEDGLPSDSLSAEIAE